MVSTHRKHTCMTVGNGVQEAVAGGDCSAQHKASSKRSQRQPQKATKKLAAQDQAAAGDPVLDWLFQGHPLFHAKTKDTPGESRLLYHLACCHSLRTVSFAGTSGEQALPHVILLELHTSVACTLHQPDLASVTLLQPCHITACKSRILVMTNYI